LKVALFRHFVTPWMALGLILCPFAIVGVTVWYPHVKHSCIDSNTGTFVARNFMAPLLINKASVPGNSYFVEAEFQCRQTQRRVCDQLYAQTDSLQRSDVFTMEATYSRFNQSVAANDVFDRCVDTGFLADQFNSSCCGLDGYVHTGDSCERDQNKTLCPIDVAVTPPTAFRQVEEYLSNQACHVADAVWELEDARFNCAALEDTCRETSCTGVDEELILSLTIVADCQVEVYLVKCCILVLLALYHAILINLSCTLIFNGVKQLRWRSLKPDGIQLRTHVNARGDLVKGQDREDRSNRIAIAMRRFEIIGSLQVILGSIVFGSWFISFFILRQKLDDFEAM
jgi:hypothetical protein